MNTMSEPVRISGSSSAAIHCVFHRSCGRDQALVDVESPLSQDSAIRAGIAVCQCFAIFLILYARGLVTIRPSSTIRSHEMSRYLDNLERLCSKWCGRLGAEDALFLQLKRELDSRRMHRLPEPRRHDWSVSYDTFVKRQSQTAMQRP